MIADSPQLLIIAGPNGAGKSTFSKDMSRPGAFIFDTDKEIAKIEARFPGLPFESISYTVDQYFLDKVDDALNSRTDFTLETNFRDAGFIMDTVSRFKGKGYSVDLIYMGLSSIELSMERVAARVQAGGHDVDAASIRYNYEEGLKNLAYFAGRFYNVEFIDASGGSYRLKSLLSVQNRELVFVTENRPMWAEQALFGIEEHFGPRFPDRDEDTGYRRGPRR